METENRYIETDLGNVAPNPRGDYSAEAAYEYLDLVVYQGGSYLCIVDTSRGVAPESGKTTETWQVLTLPGDLTPEYVAMHDDVVNKAASKTATSAASETVETAKAAQKDIADAKSNAIKAVQEAATEEKKAAAASASAAQASEKAAKASAEAAAASATEITADREQIKANTESLGKLSFQIDPDDGGLNIIYTEE